jgi:hypothetical protein
MCTEGCSTCIPCVGAVESAHEHGRRQQQQAHGELPYLHAKPNRVPPAIKMLRTSALRVMLVHL